MLARKKPKKKVKEPVTQEPVILQGRVEDLVLVSSPHMLVQEGTFAVANEVLGRLTTRKSPRLFQINFEPHFATPPAIHLSASKLDVFSSSVVRWTMKVVERSETSFVVSVETNMSEIVELQLSFMAIGIPTSS